MLLMVQSGVIDKELRESKQLLSSPSMIIWVHFSALANCVAQ